MSKEDGMESMTIEPTFTDSLITFNGGGEPIVTIRPDGTVEMNPNLPADECARQAAEIFWKAFSGYLMASIKKNGTT